MKKVLILSGSPRIGGNSDLLCNQFAKGATDAGNQVVKINVATQKVHPCIGCYTCETTGSCVFADDMPNILQQIVDADVIVLASPVYFYSVSAQLKAVIDRTVARWLEVQDKEFYYIATCADDDEQSVQTTLACFRGYADCVEGAKEMGVLCGTGVHEKGEIATKPIMDKAYQMGKNA